MRQFPAQTPRSSLATALCGLVALAGCSVSLEGSAPSVGGGAGPLPEQPEQRVDAGQELPQDAAPSVSDAPPDSGCNVEGRYAIRVAFDVAWEGTSFAGLVPVISAGSGELSFIVLVDISRAGGQVQAVAQACAADVPEFESSLQERYLARFPHAIWESSLMPRFRLEPRYGCFEPGCTFDTDAIFAQLGSQLDSPSAVWPMRAAGGSWPDHDNDSLPGITVKMAGPTERNAQGQSYAYPPVALNPLFTRRVTDLLLGLRIGLTLKGKLIGCDGLEGQAPMGSIDTRAIACVAEDSPTACSADELAFLDDNLPVWTVRGGGFRGVRVDKSASCAAARAVFP